MDFRTRICPECGSSLPPTGAEAVCPKCCFALAMELDLGKTAVSAEASVPERSAHAFGDYELLEPLGEGGMGIVYKARQRKLNRTVAVKMLRSGSLATKGEVSRFQVEAQAAARLRHPNIVAIHEVGHLEGRPFFSMDYIQGKSLSDILRRTPLPAMRAARYTKILAEAMQFAHSQGILHRDLKPSNVLVDSQDQPHITDFGLAKELDSSADITVSGAILGTPSYMSPEQAAGKRKQIGAATDIYSLGAILYDLLTGRPPFRADSPRETMRQVMELEPAPPRLLNAKVDKDLETICLKCLSKEARHRYDSAQAVADDLGRFLRNEPIQARPVGYLARGYRWGKRNPSLTAFAAMAGVLFLVLAAAAQLSRRDALESVGAVTYAADSVRLRLNEAGESVLAMARDPELGSMLSTSTAKVQPHEQKSLLNPYVVILRKFFYRFGQDQFENITLLNAEGDLLANFNPNPNAVALGNLARRDYFRGATNLADGFYVSRIYKSRSEQTWKLGVSVPVRVGSQTLAVLSGTIGTRSTDAPLGIRTDRTKTVLVGELDPMDVTDGRYSIFWHPGYERQSTNLVRIAHPFLRRLLSEKEGVHGFLRDNNYKDLVGANHLKYRGKWVAGFARVSGTQLAVIYQTRDRVRQALWTAGAVSLTLGLFSAAWALRRKLAASADP